MKWSFNHKSRKAFLTAAICLALSQSVFAMPTGGEVVQGDITGITDSTIASGGTINVNGSGLINWNAFNIANGESLTYAFSNPGTLINHVTGEEMSQILGTLSSTGNGNLWLINPNGILIGPNAQINTSSLVLSTLNATDDMLKGFLNGNDLILTGKDATKGIEIQSGAKIDVENALNILGGHIQIADNVTVSSSVANAVPMSSVIAANKVVLNNDNLAEVQTTEGNDVQIGRAVFNMGNTLSDNYIIGNNVSLTNSQFNLKDAQQLNSALDIIAANHVKYDDEQMHLSVNPDNSLTLKGVNATTNYMHVIGGKTDIDSSNLTLSKAQGTEGDTVPYMTIAALNGDNVLIDADEEIYNMANTGGTALTIKGSELNSSQNIALYGNSVALTDTKLQTSESNENNTIDILAYGSDEGDTSVTNADGFIKVTGGSIVSTSGDIFMLGSNISLDGINEMKAAKGRGIALIAGKDIDLSKDVPTLTNTTDANAISVKNTTMDTKGPVAFIGGKVDVTDGSNLTAGDLEVVAGSSYKDEGNTIEGTDTTNLTVSASTIHSNEDLTLVGSNINLANTKLEVGTPTDKTYGSNGVVRIAAAKAVELVDEEGKGFTIGSVDKTGNLSMDKVTLSAQGNVMAYGNNVTVNASDIKTQNSTGKENDLSLNALNHYERKDGSDDTWKAAKSNTLTVTDSKLTNNDMIELVGGNVALDKAEITAGDASVAARSGYKSVEVDNDNDTIVLRHNAADGMNVSIKDSKITSESGLDITGHDVTIDGKTNLSAKDFLAVGTGSAVTTDFEKNTVTTPDGKAVKVSKDTTFESDHKVIVPGIEVIDNTKPSDPGTKPSDPSTKPSDPGTKPSDPGTQPSDPGTQPTDPGTKPSDPGTKPTEPDQPSKPDKPVVTPDPKPAVDVKKNIEQGKQDMTKAIADNKDNVSAAVKQQAEKLSDSKMTDEEKAAQVKGYAEAIEDSQASAEEKQALVKDTVKSFEPTQQSSLEAQNKQDEAAQNNNAQTVIPDVTVKNVAPAEHEGAAATVTVDGTVVNE